MFRKPLILEDICFSNYLKKLSQIDDAIFFVINQVGKYSHEMISTLHKIV